MNFAVANGEPFFTPTVSILNKWNEKIKAFRQFIVPTAVFPSGKFKYVNSSISVIISTICWKNNEFPHPLYALTKNIWRNRQISYLESNRGVQSSFRIPSFSFLPARGLARRTQLEKIQTIQSKVWDKGRRRLKCFIKDTTFENQGRLAVFFS